MYAAGFASATSEKKNESSSLLQNLQKRKRTVLINGICQDRLHRCIAITRLLKIRAKEKNTKNLLLLKKSGNPVPIHPRVDSVNRRQKLRDHH